MSSPSPARYPDTGAATLAQSPREHTNTPKLRRAQRRLPNDETQESPVFALVHFALDCIALVAAWYATVELRTLANPLFISRIPASDAYRLAPPLSWMLLLWALSSVWRRLYRSRESVSVTPALLRLAESNVAMNVMAIIAVFFSRHMGLDVARSFVFLFAPVSFLLLVGSLCVSLGIAPMIERLRGPARAAILGSGDAARELIESIQNAGAAICLQGMIVPEGSNVPGRVALPVLGTTHQLAEVINRERLDRIIVVADSVPPRELERCGLIGKRMGVTISRAIQRIECDAVLDYHVWYGFHCVEMRRLPFTQAQEAAKRALDASLSAVLLMVLSPFLLGIAAAIRLTSRGPVFYRAPRVGRGGRYFTFWKFRSMYVERQAREDVNQHNQKDGHIFKIRHDPRVTPFGRFLRRTSLDELPQLFNVLKGDMSLVGPRPLPACDLDPDGMSREFSVWAEGRSRVRPGITGLWQVRGRSDLDFNQMVEFDLEYVRRWSFLLDLRILMETPLVVVSGRGAC